MSAPASTPSPARANAPPPVRVQVQVLSDLHVEFHRDGGAGMIRSLPVLGDVLVVAGDLATRTTLEPAVRLLCDRFPEVVYVAGNHEYYGSSLPRVHDTIARLAARVRNFRWLHHSAAVVAGLRFGGTPLWFRDHPANEAYAHLLNDFNQIRDFRSWVSRENEAGTGFLAGTLPDLDVVVTHHLPAPGSIDPAFATSRMKP
ncbi:MAG: metallophosphoesterase, partial [Deltaproteobacteria bacterium]|nr:metallophosphoesterase [Deltaproteobacteria bacterium]